MENQGLVVLIKVGGPDQGWRSWWSWRSWWKIKVGGPGGIKVGGLGGEYQ